MRPYVEMRVPRLKVSLYVLGLICSVLAELERDSPVMAMIHKTLVATARNCMSKVNATEADLEHLRKDPPFPEKSSCILKCLLEKVGVVNHNKYSKIGFMTAVMPLVFRSPKKLEHMKTVSDNCDRELEGCGSRTHRIYEVTILALKSSNALVTNFEQNDGSKSSRLQLSWAAVITQHQVNQNHVSPCQLGNEITTCIFKYAPELQFNKIGH